jgi:two-component system nitrate/nitrite response regulator NarL
MAMMDGVKTVKVMLVDDHSLFRSGVRQLLQKQPGIEVVAEAADGLEGVKRAKTHQPDVVMLDLNMPGLSGLETLQLLRGELPQTAVIILTVSEEASELGEALRQGAAGFLVKNIDVDVLVNAIHKAARGESVIADCMTSKLVAEFRAHGPASSAPPPAADKDKLTPREREIVACLARGESNKEIARRLDVAESTVKIHVQSILKKLNLTSRVQVAVYAVEHGLNL